MWSWDQQTILEEYIFSSINLNHPSLCIFQKTCLDSSNQTIQLLCHSVCPCFELNTAKTASICFILLLLLSCWKKHKFEFYCYVITTFYPCMLHCQPQRFQLRFQYRIPHQHQVVLLLKPCVPWPCKNSLIKIHYKIYLSTKHLINLLFENLLLLDPVFHKDQRHYNGRKSKISRMEHIWWPIWVSANLCGVTKKWFVFFNFFKRIIL